MTTKNVNNTAADTVSTQTEVRTPRVFRREKASSEAAIVVATHQVRLRQIKEGRELGFDIAEIKYQSYPEIARRVKNIEEVTQYFSNDRWETPRVTRLTNGGRVPRAKNGSGSYPTVREFIMDDARKWSRRYHGVNQGDDQLDFSDYAYNVSEK